jgi:hypothetical protein
MLNRRITGVKVQSQPGAWRTMWAVNCLQHRVSGWEPEEKTRNIDKRKLKA